MSAVEAVPVVQKDGAAPSIEYEEIAVVARFAWHEALQRCEAAVDHTAGERPSCANHR